MNNSYIKESFNLQRCVILNDKNEVVNVILHDFKEMVCPRNHKMMQNSKLEINQVYDVS